MSEDQKKPSLKHLEWLIESRGKNNATAFRLLSLFEQYPEELYNVPHSVTAQDLVAIAFVLWRAAFLTETEGTAELKAGHAEKFLRKMLADNAITFTTDLSAHEWAVNYYIGDARSRLLQLADKWPDIADGIAPHRGQRP
jgi:hypothetical protein